MARYAIKGPYSGALLTLNGAVIVHSSREEMEWLMPHAEIVRVTDGDLGQPTIELRDHPDMAPVRWPLRKDDFL